MKSINNSNFKDTTEKIKDKILTLYKIYTFLLENLNEFEKIYNITK